MGQWKVQLFKLNYDDQETTAVLDALRSGWITMGQRTLDFESAFAESLGEGSRCLAVANGTAALHMAVIAAGVGPGDEVIVPALTFIADLNSVRVSGATAVLADLTSMDDWNMDPTDLERKITSKTRAVMIVHYAGWACDMDAIVDICAKHRLPLIEDCAHATGGTHRERALGTLGALSAWSFFSNKNLAVGEGGMVATRDPVLYQKCLNLRSHGMTVASFDRIRGRAVSYDVMEPGFNYRIDEIRSSLGLVQLAKLPAANRRRGELTERYHSRLEGLEGLTVPFSGFDRGTPSWHILPLLLDPDVDRGRLVQLLAADGIQTSIHYPAIQSFTAYRDLVGPTPKAQEVSKRELTLPLYPTMTDAEVDLVCDSLGRNLRASRESRLDIGDVALPASREGGIMDLVHKLIGREKDIFASDVATHETEIRQRVASSSFLVIGGAGTIGQAVTRELCRRDPRLIHVVDTSENNLVELVRDVRSSIGYIKGEFSTFAIDCGSDVFASFMANGPGYDYVLNLSALKHVRSEKDPYTLMRMVDVNILNTENTASQALARGARKYFCVSTDKAANPVSMMGASKRIMEMFLMRQSLSLPVSTARFANVAFSDGSLLHGFNQRLAKEQPISAPTDIKRYFITPQESGELCLLSCLLGQNRDMFFPTLDKTTDLLTLSGIAELYLRHFGYDPVECASEAEARLRVAELKARRQWPVYFFESDTTGEKEAEEFYTEQEVPDLHRFASIGVITNDPIYDAARLDRFQSEIQTMRTGGIWTRGALIDLFNDMIPEFSHQDTGRFLDGRM